MEGLPSPCHLKEVTIQQTSHRLLLNTSPSPLEPLWPSSYSFTQSARCPSDTGNTLRRLDQGRRAVGRHMQQRGRINGSAAWRGGWSWWATLLTMDLERPIYSLHLPLGWRQHPLPCFITPNCSTCRSTWGSVRERPLKLLNTMQTLAVQGSEVLSSVSSKPIPRALPFLVHRRWQISVALMLQKPYFWKSEPDNPHD